MKNGKLVAGIILLIIALVFLGAIIFAGAKHQFFFFIVFAGLGYALVDESLTEAAEE